jgi:hypothetical protein
MTASSGTEWKELARRAAGGLEVAVLSDQSTGRVKVVVSDARECHHVDLEVAEPGALPAFSDRFAAASELFLNAREGMND